MVKKVGAVRIAVIDYGSFDCQKEYYNSKDEVYSIFLSAGFTTYALFPTDVDKKMPPIDYMTYDIIPYNEKNIGREGWKIVEDTLKITRVYDKSFLFVLSSNPTLLYQFEQAGIETCRLDNGRNDVIESNAHQVKQIRKIKEIIK